MTATQIRKPNPHHSRPSTVAAHASLDGAGRLTSPRHHGGSRHAARERTVRCMPTQMSHALAAFSVAAAGLGLVACSTHAARTSALGPPSTSHPTLTAAADPTHPAPLTSAGAQSTSTVTAPCAEDPSWGTGPRDGGTAMTPAPIYLARAGQHECYDRVVFDLNGPQDVGYTAKYVPVIRADRQRRPGAGRGSCRAADHRPGTHLRHRQPGSSAVASATSSRRRPHCTREGRRMGLPHRSQVRWLIRGTDHLRDRSPRPAPVPGFNRKRAVLPARGRRHRPLSQSASAPPVDRPPPTEPKRSTRNRSNRGRRTSQLCARTMCRCSDWSRALRAAMRQPYGLPLTTPALRQDGSCAATTPKRATQGYAVNDVPELPLAHLPEPNCRPGTGHRAAVRVRETRLHRRASLALTGPLSRRDSSGLGLGGARLLGFVGAGGRPGGGDRCGLVQVAGGA